MGVFKIAPGMNARFWENNDCLDNRHICVGWSKVRDLKKYRSEQELRAAVNEKQYRGRAPWKGREHGLATLDAKEFRGRRQGIRKYVHFYVSEIGLCCCWLIVLG